MRSEDLDEDDLLHQRAALRGYGHATSDEERGGGGGTTEEEEEDEQDLFNEALDPLSLLDGMHEVVQGGGAGQQPYEVLAARKRAARREQAHADVEVRAGGSLRLQGSGRHETVFTVLTRLLLGNRPRAGAPLAASSDTPLFSCTAWIVTVSARGPAAQKVSGSLTNPCALARPRSLHC